MLQLINKNVLLSFSILLLVVIGCKKKDTKIEQPAPASPQSPYKSSTAWGKLGTSDNRLNNPEKIIATDSFVFINDDGNSKIKKFDHSGNFVSALSFSSPFYIYSNYLYVKSNLNDSCLIKFDLNFNQVATYKFPAEIPFLYYDITGNDKYALITLGNVTEPFLMKLNYALLQQTTLGMLGTGNLEFKSNGTSVAVYAPGNSEIQPCYFVTDGGNYRIQQLDTSFNFIASINTKSDNTSVLNSPNIIEANTEHIIISNSNDAGDQIDFYDRKLRTFLYKLDLGGIFKTSISTNQNKLFILTGDEPMVKVFTK